MLRHVALCARQHRRMKYPLAVGLLGLIGLGFGSYTLSKTLRSGSARLRGGRRITRARQPLLFWANAVALCVLLAVSLGLIVAGVARL